MSTKKRTSQKNPRTRNKKIPRALHEEGQALRNAVIHMDEIKLDFALPDPNSLKHIALWNPPKLYRQQSTEHLYDGERCTFCNVNTYDVGMYYPDDYPCVPHPRVHHRTATEAFRPLEMQRKLIELGFTGWDG